MWALNTIIYCEIVHNYVDQNLGDVWCIQWTYKYENKAVSPVDRLDIAHI